jgi:hypothetical protein
MCRTTARSCELPLQLLQQVDDLGLDRDVERGHGLVRDDEVGVHGEGARDTDALPLAAGELVRVARGRVGRKANDLEQLADALPHLAPRCEPMCAQRLAYDPPHAVAGVERRERVLEDHLHPPAQDAELALAEPRDVGPVEHDAPARRVVEPQDRAADRRLAAAGLSDEPQRLAAANLEADVVDGLDVTDVAVEHDARFDREVDLEILQLNERPAVRSSAHAVKASLVCSHSSAGTGLKQATWWPDSTGRRGGTSRRDCSTS